MKKVVLMLSTLALCMAFVGGCNAEETKTVEWYLAPENKAALDAKIEECKSNPGELWNTPNCVNARHAAERKITGGSFKKVQDPAIPDFTIPGKRQ